MSTAAQTRAESRRRIAKMRRDWVVTLPREWRQNLSRAVSDGAEEVANFQRQLVPVDEGDLRESIGTSQTLDGLRAFIVAGDTGDVRHVTALTRRRSGKRLQAFYGVLVEYGTRNRPATPFFWPAWRALVPSLRRRFSRAFAKAFKSGEIKGWSPP